MTELEQYSFLKSALEDSKLLSEIASGKLGTPRHAVSLMHDAIEFVLYEVLLLSDQDIYRDGQHTMGLDSALAACQKLNIDIPLIGTIRAIQKHKGDAKHHAQVPHEQAFRKMLAEFRIVMSRFLYEQFGQALGESLRQLELLPYHVALYDSYRKYRTHNWKLAVRFAVGAVLHKHRAILNLPDDYMSGRTQEVLKTIKLLESETQSTNYPPAPKQILNFVRALPSALMKQVQNNGLEEAAEQAGKAYSQIDEIIPSIFDIRKARRITSHLVQVEFFTFRAMSWSRWQRADSKEKEELNSKLQSLLKGNLAFVKRFGSPRYAEDDDRYWRWWEFAVGV